MEIYEKDAVLQIAAIAQATTPGTWDAQVAWIQDGVAPTEADLTMINQARGVILRLCYTAAQLEAQLEAIGNRAEVLTSGKATLSLTDASDVVELYTHDSALRRIESERTRIKALLDRGAISRDQALEAGTALNDLETQVEARYEASLPAILWE